MSRTSSPSSLPLPKAGTAEHPTRVACIGDSITYGAGTSDPATRSYPARLQALLGSGWMVGNFGVSGSTLLNAGDKPYQKEAAFAKALDFKPQVLVIMLGTNDTKPWNFRFSGNFEADYRDLVSKFKALPGTPLIFVSKPIPVTGQGKYSINEQNLQIFIPVIEQFAARDGLRLLDLHAAFTGHADDLPDTVHPNDAGAERIARSVHAALTGASR